MGRVGVEPTRGCPQWILSPRRLPFRHRPAAINSTRFGSGVKVISGAAEQGALAPPLLALIAGLPCVLA